MMAGLAFVSEELGRQYEMTQEDLDRIGTTRRRLADDVPLARRIHSPGDSHAGAALDVARTVVRRAERLATRAAHDGELSNRTALAYLNRLSSLLFVLGRFEDQEAGVEPKIAKQGCSTALRMLIGG